MYYAVRADDNPLAQEYLQRRREEDRRMGYDSNTGDCLDCGASLKYGSRSQHSAFHASFIHRSEVKDGFAVSAVKWCDAGNHAFKANAPGSQSIDVVQRNGDGAEERVVMDMCADHAFPTASNSTPAMAQVEAAYNEERQQEPRAYDPPPYFGQ